MWRLVRALPALAAVSAALAVAGPGAPRAAGDIVDFLQSQPVSRWEFGLARLEAELQATQWPDLPQLSHSVVTVRGDGGRGGDKSAKGIVISYDMRESFDAELCARAVNAIRAHGGVRNGKLEPAYRRAGNGSHFAGFFSPPRDQSGAGGGGYGGRVDPVIAIEIRMLWGRCTGPLLSTAVALFPD